MVKDWARLFESLANETGAADEQAFVQDCKGLLERAKSDEGFVNAVIEDALESLFASTSSAILRMETSWKRGSNIKGIGVGQWPREGKTEMFRAVAVTMLSHRKENDMHLYEQDGLLAIWHGPKKA